MHKLMKLVVQCTAILLALGAQAQTTTLTVASFPDFDRAVKVAIPLYEKLHPNIKIKLLSLGLGDHHTAMTTALATGGTLPDVIGVEMAFIGKFAQSGGLEDLGKAPYNGLKYRDKMAKFAFSLGMSSSGALAGMPADIGPGALFYRKDLLDKAGVTEADLTKSWESFIKAGQKVVLKTGAYLIANAVDIKDIYIRAGLKDGEGVFFDKKGVPLVNTPRFQKAFELALAARTTGVDGRIGAWSNEWSEGFKRDRIAAQMFGAWFAAHLEEWIAPESAGHWRSAQLPGGAFASWGGSFYAIPKNAKNKAAAWEFIKFMCLNKEMQLEAFKSLSAFPALLEAQNDPFLEQPIEFLGGQKARLLWRVAARSIPSTSVDKYDERANVVVNAELDKVLEQNKDIKTALADAQKQIEKMTRRRR